MKKPSRFNKHYTDKFYEARIDSLKSARVMVPLILEFINPKSVIDVGCGNGAFLSVFKEKGIKKIFGIDGEWVNKKHLHIDEGLFLAANLEDPIKLKNKFDLVVSLEVAEHLSEKTAKTFVESLTRLGPLVLFSAAIPFQGGAHHVNEQWIDYWVDLFGERGYIPIDFIRNKIWNNDEVCFWYAQNTLLFVKKEVLKTNKKLRKEFEKRKEPVVSIVHPKLYLPKARRDNVLLKYIPESVKKFIVNLRKK